jgi:AraC-like DNA-binding protein
LQGHIAAPDIDHVSQRGNQVQVKVPARICDAKLRHTLVCNKPAVPPPSGALAKGKLDHGPRIFKRSCVCTSFHCPEEKASIQLVIHQIATRPFLSPDAKRVLTRRLVRARRMLTDGRWAEINIASLAYDAGFGDLSYFNRTFKRCYGATPSEVREAAKLGLTLRTNCVARGRPRGL